MKIISYDVHIFRQCKVEHVSAKQTYIEVILVIVSGMFKVFICI